MMFRSLFVCMFSILIPLGILAEDLSIDEQAKVQFEEGVRMYKEGDFDGASIAFGRAYELRPSYKILYNVGLVEAELKHYSLACDAYRSYLEQGGDEIDPARRAEVEKQLTRLEMLVGSVEIGYDRDGTMVLIDGERRGVLPLEAPLLVDMGTHELSLRDGIKEIYRESFRIAGGQKLTLGPTSDAAQPVPGPATQPEQPVAEEKTPAVEPSDETAAPATSTEEPKPEPASKAKPKRRFTWVALGVTAAAGVAGGVIGGISMGKESSLKDKCDGKTCDSTLEGEGDTIRHLNLSADVLYGVTAAAGVATLVLFFLEPKRAEKQQVSVRPIVGQGGLGVEGRF